jgi:large conductance mechanosensitive channel
MIIRQVNRIPKKPAPVVEPDTRECPYCITQVSIKASRCPNCTSELKPEKK